MATSSESVWDDAALRRAIRLLGAHASRIDDPLATARALRLVWDIAQRRGAATEIFQLPGTMPLVIVGNGPILLITHLDDPHPAAQVEEPSPPSITGEVVSAPGITRKAGVLAALGAILSDDEIAGQVTLVVEADRHQGSLALGYWIDATERSFQAAVCEVSDLPVPAPSIYLASTGVATIRITVSDSGQRIERAYGGVVPDVGHQLVAALASLKSVEGEVLVPQFYDGAITPEVEGLATLQRVASSVGAWLTRGVPPSEDRLSSSHLTLGAFLAPSITIREYSLDGKGPYLANQASAVVEARIMPGQDVGTIARSIETHVINRIPTATVRTILSRPSSRSTMLDEQQLEQIAQVIPVAAGNSPAGLLDGLGIPTVGVSTVWRDPALIQEQVTISGVAEGSRALQTLIRHLATATNGRETSR